MGQLIRLIKCLYHADNRPSMAIYEENDGTYRYYCFGCHAHGYINKSIVNEILDATPDHVLTYKTISRTRYEQFGAITETGKQFLSERQISLNTAVRYGILQVNNKLWLPCYDMQGIEVGGQIRYLVSSDTKYKTVRIRHVPYYSNVFITLTTHMICIVESIFDALCVYDNIQLPSIACLGTKIVDELWQWMASHNDIQYIIIPDSDALVWGSMVGTILDSMGCKYMLIDAGGKVYNSTDWDTLKKLIGG